MAIPKHPGYILSHSTNTVRCDIHKGIARFATLASLLPWIELIWLMLGIDGSKPGLCKVLVSWDIMNLYLLFKKWYHKDYENIIRIIRMISQDITKSFEESRGLWSSRISTLHGTRTVGCQWAQTVAQLGDIDSGWHLDSAIYFIGKNTIQGIRGVDYYPRYHPKHYHHVSYEYWVWLTDDQNGWVEYYTL